MNVLATVFVGIATAALVVSAVALVVAVAVNAVDIYKNNRNKGDENK